MAKKKEAAKEAVQRAEFLKWYQFLRQKQVCNHRKNKKMKKLLGAKIAICAKCWKRIS